MAEKTNVENPKVQQWAAENLVDDIEDNMTIAQLAIREISDNFHIAFLSEETVLACYATIFDSIIEVLMSKREENSSFDINIAGRFEIGYSNSEEDENEEKQGSFVPHIFDLNSGKKPFEALESKETIPRAIEWMSKNCTDNINIIKEISTLAYKNVSNRIGVHLGQEEVCLPVFINIHECMISYLKIKQAEKEEYETMINFASCFDVIIRKNEDGEQVIEYCPSISMKLQTKSDDIATSKNE